MMEFIEATYCIGVSSVQDQRIESLLVEQTVETPLSVARRYPFVRKHMMGHVLDTRPGERDSVEATLALPLATASCDVSQFLNVLFGNSSLHADVELIDFRIPASLESLFSGPRHGIDGIRQILDVWDRPLTCSALKPVGLDSTELSALCTAFVAGGIDLIKDDHYLADQSFSPFEDRVRTCLTSTAEASARRGRAAVYIPNLSGSPDAVRRQAEFAQAAGARAVMLAPMLLGLPLMHELCTRYLTIPVLAHPSFSGVIRIRPAVLLGKLFRLFGADAVIFPNYGGRFSYKPEVCLAIAENLRSSWHRIERSFPVPAGGIDAARAPELVRFFGKDSILLVGGSLLEAGDDLPQRTSSFTESVRAAAGLLE